MSNYHKILSNYRLKLKCFTEYFPIHCLFQLLHTGTAPYISNFLLKNSKTFILKEELSKKIRELARIFQ